MESPVRLLTLDPLEAVLPEGKAVSLLAETDVAVRIGNLEERELHGRNSEPNLKACEPLLIATFCTKSQTLLYSLVGTQSVAPTVG